MSLNVWVSESYKVIIVFIPCSLLGLVSGHIAYSLIVAFIIYTCWTLKQLVSIKIWLNDGADLDLAPEYLGINDQIVTSLVDLLKSYQSTKSDLQNLINQFQQMIAALPDAVIIMGNNGEIISSNKAAYDLLQIDPTRDKNTRITQLIRNPIFTDYFSTKLFIQPLELRGSSEEEPELSVRIFSFGVDRLVLIAQDMSQSAKIYEMRRSFISNASHELRTPLTVILGYLESLSMNQALPDECKDAISSTEVQAHRMKQLVEDLLTLSRLESTSSNANETNVIPISSLVTEVVEEVKLSDWFNEHNINTKFETNAKLNGDLREIHSVISNLISNAIKHTEPKTNINVVWKLDRQGNGELIVEDTGPGIEAEHIERLTERFYRVDAGRSREKGGTGLGLSIVKHIIGRHDGNLEIQSILGHGSIFICNFPKNRIVLHQT